MKSGLYTNHTFWGLFKNLTPITYTFKGTFTEESFTYIPDLYPIKSPNERNLSPHGPLVLV